MISHTHQGKGRRAIMKAVQVTKFVENYSDLTVASIPSPASAPDTILVRVHAAGVNFVDTLYARGKHQNNRSLVLPPFTLGLEFAGTVLSAPASSSWKPGDRVFGGSLGSYAEQIRVAPSVLHAIPDGWSFPAAAGLAATLPVSYGALVTRGGLKKGETVLVLGAAGGLGCMAVQVAAAAGCKVIGVAAGAEKGHVVRDCGAEHVVDYSSDKEWWKKVLSLTGGRGVDVVYDSVGMVHESLKCIAHRGRILIVGFAGRDEKNLESVAVNRVLLKQVSLIGYRYGESLRRDPEENRQIWEELAAVVKSGKIRPVLYDEKYDGLEAVPRALQAIAERKVWGKAVITIPSSAEDPAKARL